MKNWKPFLTAVATLSMLMFVSACNGGGADVDEDEVVSPEESYSDAPANPEAPGN